MLLMLAPSSDHESHQGRAGRALPIETARGGRSHSTAHAEGCGVGCDDLVHYDVGCSDLAHYDEGCDVLVHYDVGCDVDSAPESCVLFEDERHISRLTIAHLAHAASLHQPPALR